MIPSNIYRMTQPTVWATTPDSFSYSSLSKMEQCPLQWQLANSRYGELHRFPARPNPATAEGDIVHQVLDQLFRALSLIGLPEFGSETFRQCVANVDIRGSIGDLMREHEKLLGDHPRGSSCRLRVGNQQLVNKIIRLFRTQYHPANDAAPGQPVGSTPVSTVSSKVPSGPALVDFLKARGALSELPLSHPSLPFSGIIDLVRLDHKGVSIIDFKTGKVREDHLKQVKLYAVLWWRCSSMIPYRCEVRYPSESRQIEVVEDDLLATESELRTRIDKAGSELSTQWSASIVADHCSFCDVRQFCNDFWSERVGALPKLKAKNKQQQTVDVELTVTSEPSDHGFEAETGDGTKVAVVFQRYDMKLHGPFILGERLRILRAAFGSQNGEIELKSWTEVFHRAKDLE